MKINQPQLSKSKVSIVYQINDANLATTLDSGESYQGSLGVGSTTLPRGLYLTNDIHHTAISLDAFAQRNSPD
jgi:hypothetical protein